MVGGKDYRVLLRFKTTQLGAREEMVRQPQKSPCSCKGGISGEGEDEPLTSSRQI